VAGGLLIVWSSYIHFHLWQKVGYRHIPTIGPLFLLQSIAGLAVGALVIGARRVWSAAIGVGFVLSTLIGFLISVVHGLFGFKELWSSPFAHQAFAIELATLVVLAIGVGLCLFGARPLGQDAAANVRGGDSIVATPTSRTHSGPNTT
jgi:hypothetical protein